MSQSPLDAKKLNGLASYKQGWKALNRLLHENKSFSGRETNNAFLNCGDGGRFADISTAIGWDFADDARAIGLIDWDQDGDLDLWVSNRTGPRVRLLKNNLQSEANFLSVHLTGNGKSTNRDGIGSRVEVHLAGQKTPLIRTLHAGQSFLSQSSRWLHFGLGEKARISHLVVHWAGGQIETFSGATPDGFFHLFQGAGKALPRRSAQPITLTPSEQLPTPATSLARTIAPSGHALPAINDYTVEGSKTLIALWSHTCPHCLEELTAWSENPSEWAKHDIRVLALSTDLEARAPCEALLKKLGSPFELVMATVDTVESLDALQAALVDLWTPIPVPTSFLVSKEGELLAIYRGPVSREQVIADSAVAEMTPAQRRDYGTPFKGRWVGDPTPGTPQRAAQQLLDRARIDAAISYLQLALTKPFVLGSDLDKGDNQLLLGQLLGQRGRIPEAIPPLIKARQLLPDDLRVLRLLATGYLESNMASKALEVLDDARNRHPGNLDLLIDSGKTANANGDLSEALKFLEEALKQAPERADTRFHLADVLLKSGQAQPAIAHYKGILGTNPRVYQAANELARVLCTHPDESIRSPQEALALADRLCKITQNRNIDYLLTYALAQANLGEFEKAEELLQQLKSAPNQTSKFSAELAVTLKSVSQREAIRNKQWKSSN
ncbi:tetratricopeptide repeat protein [Akkermansiaceae bacterium]|nr:tetratricopeptide repeat protein [Akkermansiaceae bacterium]MDB4537737.1 tetratricopeptide repeat protein [Akkermansiaceae bacterium]